MEIKKLKEDLTVQISILDEITKKFYSSCHAKECTNDPFICPRTCGCGKKLNITTSMNFSIATTLCNISHDAQLVTLIESANIPGILKDIIEYSHRIHFCLGIAHRHKDTYEEYSLLRDSIDTIEYICDLLQDIKFVMEGGKIEEDITPKI
ncbi:MAG: hypothetical protein HXS54_06085 [Theionarchaea archaeon]|nr:hypothetical protein [Theionarchaea archaeon]DBA34828.1 TPA_asm: hypothetical protein vir521_00034 [Caudoviricetes sp. vir521]